MKISSLHMAQNRTRPYLSFSFLFLTTAAESRGKNASGCWFSAPIVKCNISYTLYVVAHVVFKISCYFQCTYFCCKSNILYRKMEKTIHRNCVLTFKLNFQNKRLNLQENQLPYSKERKIIVWNQY